MGYISFLLPLFFFHPRIFLRKPRILALHPLIARNVLRKPRPRVAVFYVFSTLPASGRFASEGSFVSFLVCFAQGITVRYAVGRLGTRSHAFFIHGTRVRSTCNRERYAAALAMGVSLRRPNKGLCLREERSLQTWHGIRGLFAQS